MGRVQSTHLGKGARLFAAAIVRVFLFANADYWPSSTTPSRSGVRVRERGDRRRSQTRTPFLG